MNTTGQSQIVSANFNTGPDLVRASARPAKLNSPPTAGPVDGEPPFFKLPPWQRERAARLASICPRIARAGNKIRAIRRFSRHWNGKPFQSDRKRAFALSQSTLKRIFQEWRHAGAAAFSLHYCIRPSVPKSRAHWDRIRALLWRENTTSIIQIYRILFSRVRPATSLRSFYRQFTAAERARLRRIFRERLRHERNERSHRAFISTVGGRPS